MAQAVLADSEDEEDDLLSDAKQENVPNTAQTQIVVTHFAGERSTGSTERLKRHIFQAQSDLGAQSALRTTTCTSTNMPKQTLETPSLKRRHSEIPTKPRSATARLKRVKSAKTSPSFSSGLLSQNGLVEDAFSEHSQQPTSSGFIPQGSIKEGFLAHEPYSIFGQSGDTVPNNTATQQLVRDWVAEEHTDAKGLNHSSCESADGLQFPRSSSVLFTTSQLFNSPQIQAVVEAKQSGTVLPPAEELPAPNHDLHQADTRGMPMIEEFSSSTIHVGPKISDVARTDAPSKPVLDVLSSEPTSSQTALIGLPPEKYVPRPTRSRAAQLPELTHDDISNPNSITRATRSKTKLSAEDSTGTRPTTHVDDEGSEATRIDTLADEVVRVASASKVAMFITDGSDGRISDFRQDQVPPESRNPLVPDATYARDELALSQTSITMAELATSSPKASFAQPAMLKRGMKATRKSKRSHTTIFEDHIDLTLSQQAPKLSQRQAERKALLEVENALNGRRSQRNKPKPANNDEEEEDELALGFDSSRKEDSVKTAIKTSKHVGSPSKLPEIANSSSSPVKSAKTRGRSRQSKAVAAIEVVKVPEEAAPASEDTPAFSSSPSKEDPQHAITPEATPPLKIIQPHTDASEERVAKKHLEPPKSSPVTHSPIKVVAGPTMRVGLSKRHRIPSLLKVVRAAKK